MIYNIRTPHAAAASATIGATTTQLGTIIAAEDRSMLLLELDFQGQGNASGANELGIYRVGTAGSTSSNGLTITPVHPSYPTAGVTGFFTYGTQPVAGALIHPFGLNSNGQRYFWRCNPNLNNAIVAPGGAVAAASLAIFPISGSGSMTGRLQVMEL